MPGKVRFGIEGVRRLARERVEQTSLRAVAGEIGMSNSGLHSFLKGGEPYSPVRKKLVAWFVRARFPESRPIPAVEIDAATSVLAAYIRRAAAPGSMQRTFMQISERIAAEVESGNRQEALLVESDEDARVQKAVKTEYPTNLRRRRRR
jgi:hypothetical protein